MQEQGMNKFSFGCRGDDDAMVFCLNKVQYCLVVVFFLFGGTILLLASFVFGWMMPPSSPR